MKRMQAWKLCYMMLTILAFTFVSPNLIVLEFSRLSAFFFVITRAVENSYTYGPFDFSLDEGGQTQLQLVITLALKDDPYHLPDDKNEKRQYGLERIQIYQRGQLLQTLDDVGDWEQNLSPGTLSNDAPFSNFGITRVDCNFDGYYDLKIFIMPNGKSPYHQYFLFSPQAFQFEHFEALSDLWNPVFDQQKKMIVERVEGGGGEWGPYKLIYSRFEGTQIKEVKRFVVDFLAKEQHYLVLRQDWIDDKWVDTYQENVGSGDLDRIATLEKQCGDAPRWEDCQALP
jgi:hypothetical protein